MDAVASLYNRHSIHDVLSKISKNVFCPITVGGGVRSTEDARKLFKSGADKIAVNSILFSNFDLLSNLVNEFGSESIVLSVESKKREGSEFTAYFNSGREDSGLDVNYWIKKCVDNGVGQVLITSVDNDGTKKGLDLKLIEYLYRVPVPVVLSGGFGDLDHVLEIPNILNFDAIAVGSALHYKNVEIMDLKIQLTSLGLDLRLN